MHCKLNSQYNTSYTMGCEIILTYCFCDQHFKHCNIILNRCDEQLNVLILFYEKYGSCVRPILYYIIYFTIYSHKIMSKRLSESEVVSFKKYYS